jgi:hypothetical protein
MSNTLKGLLAGLVATIVLSAVMLLNSSMGFYPQADLIRLLRNLGTLTAPSAWMDHFIIGVVVWGLLFACYDAVAMRPAYWLKGIIFGVFAWLVMMMAFLPLAGSGFLGSKLENTTLVGLLILHLIYGAVLGGAYTLLSMIPARVPVVEPKPKVDPNDVPKAIGDFSNDDLPSSSPSFRTTVMILSGLAGFIVLVVLAVEFRAVLWS